jgi:hypothetical protein
VLLITFLVADKVTRLGLAPEITPLKLAGKRKLYQNSEKEGGYINEEYGSLIEK